MVIFVSLCFKLKKSVKFTFNAWNHTYFGKKMLKIEQAYPFQSVPTLTGEWVAVFEGQNMTFGYEEYFCSFESSVFIYHAIISSFVQ